MPIVKKLHRICRDCGNKFVPSKYQKICNKCTIKNQKLGVKKRWKK